MFDHTTQHRTPDHRPSNWTNWIICQRWWWWWRCTHNAPSWLLCAECVNGLGALECCQMCIILSSILLLFYCNVCWLHICSRLNRKELYSGDYSLDVVVTDWILFRNANARSDTSSIYSNRNEMETILVAVCVMMCVCMTASNVICLFHNKM